MLQRVIRTGNPSPHGNRIVVEDLERPPVQSTLDDAQIPILTQSPAHMGENGG